MSDRSRTAIAQDDRENNLVVAGFLLALLVTSRANRVKTLQTVEAVIDADGNPTNQIDISVSIMRSTYRLTVERVPDGDR